MGSAKRGGTCIGCVFEPRPARRPAGNCPGQACIAPQRRAATCCFACRSGTQPCFGRRTPLALACRFGLVLEEGLDLQAVFCRDDELRNGIWGGTPQQVTLHLFGSKCPDHFQLLLCLDALNNHAHADIMGQ